MAEQNNSNQPPISLNTFVKGMNKDTSKYALSPDQYYDGQNVRIVASDEKEGAALVNVEGNDYMITIPCSPSVFSLTLDPAAILTAIPWTANVTITVQMGVNVDVWTISLAGTGGNPINTLAEKLKNPGTAWLRNGLAAPNLPSKARNQMPGFFWSFDESSKRIVIWGKPDMTSPELRAANAGNITGSPIVNQVTGIVMTGGYTLQETLAFPQCDLDIIGYTTLRENIYLFTTNWDPGKGEVTDAALTADGDNGQIWRLHVDTAIQDVNGYEIYLECIYSAKACINFSKQHPIEAIGRYEKKDIQGIYWTDNFNPPRKLNVVDPDAMATPCAFLDLAPKTGLQIPTLNIITIGGSLEAGVYQLAYRYKNSEGLVTDWSPLSNLVPIYASDDSNPFCTIIGSPVDPVTNEGEVTSKAITWTLSGLDITYELLELAAVYRKDNVTANADIYIFNELTNGLTNLNVTLSGSEDKIPITMEDFLTGIGTTFERVKTLESKDNKLFFGNITNTSFNVDYDSRVYRFDASQDAVLDSLSDAPIQLDGSNLVNPIAPYIPIIEVPEGHDCVNSYNDENPATNPNWFTNDQYIFQADGQTLGGTGVNVSYTFITERHHQDTLLEYYAWMTNSTTNWSMDSIGSCTGYNPQPQSGCFLTGGNIVNTVDNLGIPVQNYPMNNTWDNYKSPYNWSLYGGYSRGETYRFGIVFYNNKGQASFVNWIGDIKFPYSYSAGLSQPFGTFNIHDWVGAPASPQFNYLGHMYDWVGDMYTNNIGIEFSVNLDPLTSGIDVAALGITGYSIVRCDRKTDDMSRFGTGLIGTVDRLRMISDEWDDIGGAGCSNYWGVGNSGDVLIPSAVRFSEICGGAYLAATDGIDDLMNCELYPYWGTFVNSGTQLCTTRKREVLLYGPLGWQNSDPATPMNYSGGLGVDTPLSDGDYIKTEGVFMPMFNSTMGLGSLTMGAGAVWRNYSNHYMKWYYPTTLAGGIPGANAVGAPYAYASGIASNAFSQDPVNDRMQISWGTWVPDGGRVDGTAVPSMGMDFVNVTNPGNEDDVITSGRMWPACRPHSIGSEAYLLNLKEDWMGCKVLMGASLSGIIPSSGGLYYQYMHTPFRATFSYERYVTPYGGNTFSTRARSEYMSTGHFMPIVSIGANATPLGVPLVHQVWGGDVTTQMYDFTMHEKNWGQTDFDNYDSLDSAGWNNLLGGDASYGYQRNMVFPAEVHHKNIMWRMGYHFANKGSGGQYPNNGTGLHDEMKLNGAYASANDVRTYFPKPFNLSLGDEFDTRVYYSETKINGEPVDSWAVFLNNNYKDVEGVYGQINKLSRLHDTMYYFQDAGFGSLAVNPTAVVQASDGSALQLGTVSSGAGAFIQDYQYISTRYGARQQWAVTNSDSSLYFFDIDQRKMFRYSAEGTAPLSDITGMHSYFLENLSGSIMTRDNPILKEGIACTYDSQNNEVLYTFHDKGFNKANELSIIKYTAGAVITIILREPVVGCNPCLHQPCDEFVIGGSSISDYWWVADNVFVENLGPYRALIMGRFCCPAVPLPIPNPDNFQCGDTLMYILPSANDGLHGSDWNDLVPLVDPQTVTMGCPISDNSFTVGYNELIGGYTAFYDFHPTIYVNSGSYFITGNTESQCILNDETFRRNELYLHNVGRYGEFYDQLFQSKVTLISNMQSPITKVFDNVSFHMESIWLKAQQQESASAWIASANTGSGTFPAVGRGKLVTSHPIDIPHDTFDTVRFYTDYQMSDYVTLTPGANIRKKEREWQMMVPRNIMDENLVDADIFNVYNYDSTRLFKDRMRDKYLFIELIYNNFDSELGDTRNIKFILHYFKTFFRHSYR
tara:strand:+ start:19770 stop:25271 length:5502 start_codon:yes stop_codon:yes gene_type:complete